MNGAPLVDHGRLELITGGDASIREELIELFLQGATRHIGATELAVTSGESTRVARATHALRGAALNFGATRLGLLAEAAERLALSGSVAEDLVTTLQRVFADTRLELELELELGRGRAPSA